jgi:hypothetical protein
VLETTTHMLSSGRSRIPSWQPAAAALLKWAVMLHEVGLNINHSGMHRHSAYILQNSDLPGFNQEQQMLMATLVRYHRKAIKLDDLPRFTLFRKSSSAADSAAAPGVLLNNQRQATTTPPTLRLQTEAHHWTLTFPHDWFSQNALVLLDLEKEQQYWEGVPEWLLKIRRRARRLIASNIRPGHTPGFCFRHLLRQLRQWYRYADIIALHIIDPQRDDRLTYLRRFHIFRHHLHVLHPRQMANRATTW